MKAVQRGNFDIVKFLVEKEADVNHRTLYFLVSILHHILAGTAIFVLVPSCAPPTYANVG